MTKEFNFTICTIEEAFMQTMLQCESLSTATEMLKLFRGWQNEDDDAYEGMVNFMDALEKGKIPEEEENSSLFVCVDDDILEILNPFDGDAGYYPCYMERDTYAKFFGKFM